jgi:hypothetical protein
LLRVRPNAAAPLALFTIALGGEVGATVGRRLSFLAIANYRWSRDALHLQSCLIPTQLASSSSSFAGGHADQTRLGETLKVERVAGGCNPPKTDRGVSVAGSRSSSNDDLTDRSANASVRRPGPDQAADDAIETDVRHHINGLLVSEGQDCDRRPSAARWRPCVSKEKRTRRFRGISRSNATAVVAPAVHLERHTYSAARMSRRNKIPNSGARPPAFTVATLWRRSVLVVEDEPHRTRYTSSA